MPHWAHGRVPLQCVAMQAGHELIVEPIGLDVDALPKPLIIPNIGTVQQPAIINLQKVIEPWEANLSMVLPNGNKLYILQKEI